MNEEEKIQLLDDYLHERLTAQQLVDFQQMLASDPELRKELELHETLIRGIVLESKTSHFKKHLTELRKEADAIPLHEPASKKNRKIPVWGWAAGLAAMLLMGFFYFWIAKSVSGETLYADNYEPYPSNVLASITRGDSGMTLQQQAVQAYENGRYEKAIPMLEEILNKEPENAGWQLVLGICYLENNDAEEAEKTLLKAAQNPNSLFYQQAQWYLALTYLKQNNKKQAASVLKDLAAQSGVYPQKAKQLLTEL